ncbi:unnamed protein product [Sphagnum jensenii]|uniref:Epidermal patterning factor-like protein n=2 Tax=Sphagnum jensenii TaxID=128206 RepID=A0ABP0WDX8_9BRYO
MQPSWSKTRIEWRGELTTLGITLTILSWWIMLLMLLGMCPSGVSKFGGSQPATSSMGAVTEMPFRQYSHEAADQAVDLFSLQVAAGTYGQSTVRESCQLCILLQRLHSTFSRPAAATSLRNYRNSRFKEAKMNRRLLLVGPGSSPPTCQAKCGLCTPCKPVRVATGGPHAAAAASAVVGVISETEYYPEVWRCQCGDTLFMP